MKEALLDWLLSPTIASGAPMWKLAELACTDLWNRAMLLFFYPVENEGSNQRARFNNELYTYRRLVR